PIVIHLVGAYQVFCQPLFAFIEKWASSAWPESSFVTCEISLPLGYCLSLFWLAWRSAFVVLTTMISMLMPFFNDVVGLLGALGFWPLMVYFPMEMYIAQKKIPRWSTRWVCLQMLSDPVRKLSRKEAGLDGLEVDGKSLQGQIYLAPFGKAYTSD
ncbi:amino acid permease 3-like, partial [Zingiber officinale]|uniref:amino acid permease 3-like n=1 Tax=Zingiber officinale TaxID=94328 RepID=UPI001C4A939C